MCPAVPLYGSRERKLKCGDLVFVDVGFGVNGYHTDKTQVYMFGGKPPEDVMNVHRGCMRVQRRVAELLRPGAIPSRIYDTVMSELNGDFKKGFMGYQERTVKFLGHGIGLYIDETPVIAKGFDEPLKENMVIAMSPKRALRISGSWALRTLISLPRRRYVYNGGGRDIISV
jgi:Xaa-Pro aminopeptidase